jgi:TatD DNase family protein
VYSDAHLHLVDLAEREPSFDSRLVGKDWVGAVVSHDAAEFERSEVLRQALPPTVAGFGIHPQGIREDTMEFLADLAARKRIGFIGEAGFDFFGDRAARVRNAENIRDQRRCFEFQLDLGTRHGLPLLIHSRKSTDLLLGYGRQLSRLPAVIFHGWPGRLDEAKAFLSKGVKAYFSFGTTLLRDARHAMES